MTVVATRFAPARAAAFAALLCLLAAVRTGDAHAAERIYRIGYLAGGSIAATSGLGPAGLAAFRERLRELGWLEGRNVVIEYRSAEGRLERLPGLTAELLRQNVDVIVATPTPAAVAAKNATTTVPIVMAGVGDPVAVGLVASLAHPGGNITGVSYSVGSEIFGKQLQLLKDAVPSIRRVAVLSNPANPGHRPAVSNVKESAPSLGVSLQLLEARDPAEFEGIFAAIAKERAEGLLVVADSMFGIHRERLADLATRNRLPSVFGLSVNVEAGGLMSYGPDFPHQLRQAAGYVDKILKGAKPGDLPVEQPTKFELVVNLKTAKALGLTMPQSLLQRADHVIE